MKRPKPTINLILEMLVRDEKLLKKTYRGLHEVSLSKVYPSLNLDEAVAFAAISWGDRWREINQYAAQIDQMELYAIVNSTMGRGMAALNSSKRISEESRGLYEKINPFKGDLKQRLENVSDQDQTALREDLKQRTKYYASEGQYMMGHARKNADAEGKELEVMRFLPVYLRSANPESIKRGYATQIARMLSRYPRTFEPMKMKTVAEQAKVDKPRQLSLL